MAHEAIKTPVSDELVNDKPTTQNKQATITDLATGEVLDAKQIRVKIANEQAAAIELLKQHYSEKVGKDLNLSEMLLLLIGEDLKQKFSLNHKQLQEALKVSLPKVALTTPTELSLPKISVGGTNDER